MEKIPEFVANHLFLFSLLTAILVLLIWNIYGDVISGIRQVTPAEATRMINHENAVILDIRKADEFADGHIINAVNIPMKDIENRRKELEKYKDLPVILYCMNGSDSPRVARILRQTGMEKTCYLKGGLIAWRNANMPIDRNKQSSTGAI